MQTKDLFFLSTATGTKEKFVPRGDVVSLYVCGVTPYAMAHMGHARCYVSFDVLHRLLLWAGYAVQYVQNITDVDDKIVRKAQEALQPGQSLAEEAVALARRYAAAFNEDMDRLRVLRPGHQPRISDNMPAIISFIEELIAAGHAYQAGGDVYFSVDSFATYGALSCRSAADLAAGARVEVGENKRNPSDFSLWKGGVVGSFWQSPWGPGRPGWHIECSALVRRFLGTHIDIHGGGIDLLFPHHENERAQSEALFGPSFARYWLHNAHVTLNAHKMSKSEGNVLNARALMDEFDPMIIRFYLVQHHYRTPLDIDRAGIASAAKAYARLVRLFNPEANPPAPQGRAFSSPLWQEACASGEACREVVDALADDMNVPKALGIIFAQSEALASNALARQAICALLQDVCGLALLPVVGERSEVSPAIARLLEERAAARAAKDWVRADALREELAALGYVAADGKIAG